LQEILWSSPATTFANVPAVLFLLLADYGVAVPVMKELSALFQYFMYIAILIIKCVGPSL
jgi:hypothetical protein